MLHSNRNANGKTRMIGLYKEFVLTDGVIKCMHDVVESKMFLLRLENLRCSVALARTSSGSAPGIGLLTWSVHWRVGGYKIHCVLAFQATLHQLFPNTLRKKSEERC